MSLSPRSALCEGSLMVVHSWQVWTPVFWPASTTWVFFNPKWSKSPSFLPALFGEVWGVTLFASLSVVSGVLIKACRVKTPSPGMSRRHLGCHLGLVSQECVSLILLCGPFFFFFFYAQFYHLGHTDFSPFCCPISLCRWALQGGSQSLISNTFKLNKIRTEPLGGTPSIKCGQQVCVAAVLVSADSRPTSSLQKFCWTVLPGN